MNTFAQSSTHLAFTERLNRALDFAGVIAGRGRIAALSRIAGTSQEAARKWMRGGSIPSAHRIVLLSQKLGCNSEWLLSGRGPAFPDRSRNESQGIVAGEVVNIPVIRWRDITPLGVDRSHPDKEFTMVAVPNLSNRPDLFGLRVRDDAMSGGEKPLPINAIAIIDPDAQPTHGQIVLALIDGEPTLRQYIVDGKSKLLRPTNAQFSVRTMAPSDVFLGVMVGYWMDV